MDSKQSSDEQVPRIIKLEPEQLSFWDKHRLSLLLIITVIIALVMTTISVIIYNKSGAAQLDLSRPGYLSVSNKVEQTDNMDSYSATGPVDKQAIEEFMAMYDNQADKIKNVDAFGGDPLNPDTLEFGTNTEE